MDYKTKYQEMYESMAIKPARLSAIDAIARRIIANKARYQTIEKQTGVPWQFIGVVHYRESNLKFNCNLHNGEPLNVVTTLVPEGRGPFTSFEHSAVDAFGIKGWINRTDWSLGNQIVRLETYNGIGYRKMKGGNPYLWGGTNHYTKGKFVRDHVYNKDVVDVQLGCVPILKRIDELDLTKKDLVAESTTLSVFSYARATVSAIGAAITALFTLDTLAIFREVWATINEFGKENWFIILALALTACFALLKWAEHRKHIDYQRGNYTPRGMSNVDAIGPAGDTE